MRFDMRDAVAVLERTPGVLRAMLDGLGDAWLRSNYGNDTFSPFDVVGHLIQGEKTDWIVRTRIILEHGPSRTFDKYDRYAQFEASRGKSIGQLLDEFETLRRHNLQTLAALAITPEKLALRGMHAALGEVTLEQLLSTWVAHDLNHMAQIAKCMATQYADAVGPWREYLGVLKTPITRMDADGASRRRIAVGGPGARM
ncbi:MAG: DinB family protein [Phycisphaerae bacterium]